MSVRNIADAIHSTLRHVEPNALIGWTGPAFGSFAIHNWKFVEGQEYVEVIVAEAGFRI